VICCDTHLNKRREILYSFVLCVCVYVYLGEFLSIYVYSNEQSFLQTYDGEFRNQDLQCSQPVPPIRKKNTIKHDQFFFLLFCSCLFVCFCVYAFYATRKICLLKCFFSRAKCFLFCVFLFCCFGKILLL
jgi:hypothetical protein